MMVVLQVIVDVMAHVTPVLNVTIKAELPKEIVRRGK